MNAEKYDQLFQEAGSKDCWLTFLARGNQCLKEKRLEDAIEAYYLAYQRRNFDNKEGENIDKASEDLKWRLDMLGCVRSGNKFFDKRDLTQAKEYYQQADEMSAGESDADIWGIIYDVRCKIRKIDEIQHRRMEVFLSYAHKDMKHKVNGEIIDYARELARFFKALSHTKKIKYWDDKEIRAGEKWNEVIHEALSRAKVIVMMVSNEYMASEYIWNYELGEIRTALDEGATILWLLISHCDYEEIAMSEWQAILPLDQYLVQYTERLQRDKLYTKLIEQVKKIFQESMLTEE